MREESYLSLLILCLVLSQGNAIISHEKIENSSATHIRNKRVISHSAGGVQPAHVTLSRHLVQILVADTFECAGSILQDNIIVTVRACLYGTGDQYTVLSGSLIKGSGTRHRVIATSKHPRYNLALMRIHPPIILSPLGSNKISLFTGPLPLASAGIFSGWGCTNISPTGERTYPHQLMSTLLPIITYQQCYDASRASHGFLPLTSDICTLDRSRERGTCHGDEGSSLVYAQRLIGILSHVREVKLGIHPDVFVNLGHEDIVPWIERKTHELQSARMRHP